LELEKFDRAWRISDPGNAALLRMKSSFGRMQLVPMTKLNFQELRSVLSTWGTQPSSSSLKTSCTRTLFAVSFDTGLGISPLAKERHVNLKHAID
jgi:hypothetical protein